MPRAREIKRDRELFASLAEGDPRALADLYDRHAQSLLRHALVLSWNRADAEDLVHVVFVKLADIGVALLGVRDPGAYLHRIVHTTWLDGIRRGALFERVTAAGPAALSWVNDFQWGPEESIDAARALNALPPSQRQAVVLHAVEGFSFREIGRLTGVSIFTAAGRYRSGIARLRRALTHGEIRRHETPRHRTPNSRD